MRTARKLLIAAALLSWPWISGAPQAGAAPPAAAPAGIGFRGAPSLLRLAADHDRDKDHHRRHRRRHHHHRRHRRNEERREHEH